MILELAGGELAAGVVDVGRRPPPRPPIVLRLCATPADPGHRRATPTGCGKSCRPGERRNVPSPRRAGTLAVVPPSWRRDLSREIDLIEEVARIHGYEKIPEDVGVPMVPSARRREDRVVEKIRPRADGLRASTKP